MPCPNAIIKMNEYTNANRKLWNAWTKIHENSAFYDNESFKAGHNTLRSIELEELGNVSGKTLLHLQCHFGQDTLSWARLGAQVTGVDLAEEAIKLAGSLATELNLDARFICSDIYELSDVLDEKFDIVFTSYGVLAWLDDLTAWAEIIARHLKPGGTLYIVEIHPFTDTLNDWEPEQTLSVCYPYFLPAEPFVYDAETSYAEPDAKHTEPITNYQWSHSLGEIINAVIGAGLQIEFLHEFPMTVFRHLPLMEERDGWWRLPEGMPELPFLFSLKAKKPI
jgi:2-polyprenyl-3-methyl-5-hydroxy-6-metoxy-1,4-benzoquinol methylase